MSAFDPYRTLGPAAHHVILKCKNGGIVAEHNKVFKAVALVGVVLAGHRLLFNQDGLAWGYGIIAVGLIVLVGFLWSERKRPDS